MNSVETVLIVVLGVMLALFLLLGIILVGIIIGIVKNIRNITQKAEETTNSFADIAMMVGKKAAPVAMSAVVAAAMRRLRKSK
ncbi:MAG: hypothetical protein ABIS59_01180 [Candidatus Saccharibacteria bacterium]|jgi:hypothetical protein